MNTPNWGNPIPACPIQAVTVAADGSNCWALSLDGELACYRESTQLWEEVSYPDEYAIDKISAGPDSSLIVFTSNGAAYKYVAGNWSTMPSTVTQAAVGNAVNYVYGDNSGKFYRDFNGTQSEVTSTWMSGIKQLSTVPAMDHVWCIKDMAIWDNVFYWGGDWVVVPGKNLQQFDLHHNSVNGHLQVVGVDANGAGWAYNDLTGLWSSISRVAFGATFTCLESSDNFIWAASNIGTGSTVHRGYFNPL